MSSHVFNKISESFFNFMNYGGLAIYFAKIESALYLNCEFAQNFCINLRKPLRELTCDY